VDERVELAALATRIARGGEIGEERSIVRAAAERRVELPGVHAHDDGAEPRLNERASELRRVTAPQRELAREIEAGGEVLAVLTHLLEEQVAEHETLDALALQRLGRLRRPRLVHLLGAARRDLDLVQRRAARAARRAC